MKLTPLQELEAAIREHPANPELYLKILPLYLESGRDYEAEKLLAKGAGETNDPRVIRQWEELTLARLQRSLAVAQQWCARGESAESSAAVADARTALERGQLAIFINRCQRDSSDAQARFDLGRCLQANGKLAEASAEFAQAMARDDLRPAAALALGDCQRDLGQIPEALKHYRICATSARKRKQFELEVAALRRAIDVTQLLKLSKLAAHYAREFMASNAACGELLVNDIPIELDMQRISI